MTANAPEQSPPHDLDAEKAVIGSVLMDAKQLGNVASLRPRDFHHDWYGRAFGHILALGNGHGGAVDSGLLTARMKEHGDWENKQSALWLAEAMQSAPAPSLAKHYASIVLEHSLRRRMIHDLWDSVQDARGGQVSAVELLDRAEEKVQRLARLVSTTAIRGAVVTRLADVTAKSLEWVWPGRIPVGKLTLLAGDPGLGKSFVTLDLAARVSRGDSWPDMPLLKQSVGNVVLFNAEDDLADTIAPRLDRAGAVDTRIVACEGVTTFGKRRHFSLEQDLPRLEEVLRDHPDTRLVVIDPIAAYCGKVDSHKNADVRGLLAPLAELAARFRVAIVAVTHLSKTGGNKAVYRAMGSLAFAAAARAVWAIVKDPADPQRRLFLPAKLNLAQDPDGLAYRIADGRVAWETEPVRMHADDAFAAEAAAAEPKQRGRGSSERREAIEWLQEQLVNGQIPSSEIIELGEQYGFSKRTLQRAFKALGGEPRKEQFDGPWLWGLPS